VNSFKYKGIKNKKGMDKLMEVILVSVALLGMIFIIWIITRSDVNKAAGIVPCFSPTEEAHCLGTVDDCTKSGGNLFKVGTCPTKDNPVCCIGGSGKPSSSPAVATTSPDQAAPTTATTPSEAPQLKGTMQFFCKCKIENGYLVGPNWLSSIVSFALSFNKMDMADIKKGNTDFKSKKDAEYEIQARGTDDVKYCRISVVGQNYDAEGACSKDNGPSVKVKFAKEGDYDVNLFGYDKKGGTRAASAVVDIKIESATGSVAVS